MSLTYLIGGWAVGYNILINCDGLKGFHVIAFKFSHRCRAEQFVFYCLSITCPWDFCGSRFSSRLTMQELTARDAIMPLQ